MNLTIQLCILAAIVPTIHYCVSHQISVAYEKSWFIKSFQDIACHFIFSTKKNYKVIAEWIV
jgi:hypothetical protein